MADLVEKVTKPTVEAAAESGGPDLREASDSLFSLYDRDPTSWPGNEDGGLPGDVPWKLIIGAVLIGAALWLLRPVLGIAENVTGG